MTSKLVSSSPITCVRMTIAFSLCFTCYFASKIYKSHVLQRLNKLLLESDHSKGLICRMVLTL